MLQQGRKSRRIKVLIVTERRDERMGQVGKESTKTKNLLERPHGNLLFNKITKNANIITVLTRNTLYEFILPQKKQIPYHKRNKFLVVMKRCLPAKCCHKVSKPSKAVPALVYPAGLEGKILLL